MGFLDKFLQKVVDSVVDGVTGNGSASNSSSASTSAPQTNYNTSSVRDRNVKHTDIRTEMYQILTTEFPEYEVRSEIPASYVFAGASPYAKNYSYGLFRNGAPVIMILLADHNKYRNRDHVGAKQACQDARIPFLFFFTHMPNERQYVINRIRQNI